MIYIMSKLHPPNFIKEFNLEMSVLKNLFIYVFSAVKFFDDDLTHFRVKFFYEIWWRCTNHEDHLYKFL